MKWFVLLFGLFLTTLAGAAPMGLVVPAYFYPPTYWDSMNYAASRVPLLVIVNPNSGPGTSVDTTYAAAVNSVRSSGAKTLGYVYTSYGARDTNAIRTDIDRYFSYYAVDGFFLDEMANTASTNVYNYYQGIYQYIQTKGTNLLVMGNPGINTAEPYLTRPTVDALMTYESDTGYSNYVVDAWVTNHLARQFCHVAYAISTAAMMTNVVTLAASRNVGWVYISDDASTSNPYDRLPVYWTNEVNYVRSLNLAQAATQLKLAGVTNGQSVLQISGSPGVYEVQASTNLQQWTAIATTNLTGSALTLHDARSTNLTRQFYRTRQ